jgi:hypothetical protein
LWKTGPPESPKQLPPPARASLAFSASLSTWEDTFWPAELSRAHHEVLNSTVPRQRLDELAGPCCLSIRPCEEVAGLARTSAGGRLAVIVAGVAVDAQQRDPGSLLAWIQRARQTLRECPEFGIGSCRYVDRGDRAVLALVHDSPSGTMGARTGSAR